MSKAPAYQHYYKEWYTGTRIFTRQQRDIYRDLLDFSYEQDGLPSDIKELENLCCCRSSSERKDLLMLIQKKFYLDDLGRYRNKRLEEVRAEQIAYREKRTNSGLKAAEARWGKEKIRKQSERNANASKSHNGQHSVGNTSSTSTSNTDTPLPPEGGDVGVSEELKNKIREVASFFKVGEIDQYQRFSEVGNFIICLDHRKRLDFFFKQFTAYKFYIGQQKDFKGWGLDKFMGTGKKFYEDGAWNDRDWSQSVKPAKTILTKAKNHQ